MKLADAKNLIETGNIYTCIEAIEDMIQFCIENEKNEDGLYFVESLLEISPYNSEYWLKKGTFLNNLLNFEEALVCFNKSISLNPCDTETLIEKAVTEENLGFLQRQKNQLKKLYSLNQIMKKHCSVLGLIFQHQENFEKAIHYYKRTLESDPEFEEAYYELGFCFESIGEYSNALITYDKFLELEPYSSNGWYNRGIVLTKLQQLEKAIDSYEFAVAIRDDFASAWFNKGNAFADLGRLQQALECFKKVYEIDKNDEAACYNIANIYEEMGDLTNAIKYYTCSN